MANPKKAQSSVSKAQEKGKELKVEASHNAAVESKEARELLRKEIELIPPYLKPAYVLASLSKESKEKMEVFVNERQTQIEQAELRSLAQAILATEFRDKQDATVNEGKVFRKQLTSYLEVTKTTTTLTTEHKQTELKLIEVYKGLASYHVNAEVVRDDTKGNFESLLDEIKEGGWDILNKSIDAYSDAEPYEKLAIAGLLITFTLWSSLSESESANNIRKTVFGLGVVGAGLIGANWAVEKLTNESIPGHIDNINATADVDSLITYLRIKGEEVEKVAETLVDGALFNQKTKHLKANEVFAKYKSLKDKPKEYQLLDYDKENLDPALFYRGVEVFYKRIEVLKVEQPEVYAEVKEAIDNDAELSEVYMLVLTLDPDAWQIDRYHTHTGEIADKLSKGKLLDTEFVNYLQGDLAGFKKWFESTEMYGSEFKKSPELAREKYFKEKFGSSYTNMLELNKEFSYSSTLAECLNSKKPIVDAVGRKRMAVSVKVSDTETPDVYVKKAYDALKAKYQFKGEVEPILGTIIEQPSKTYVLMVRDVKVDFNPIV